MRNFQQEHIATINEFIDLRFNPAIESLKKLCGENPEMMSLVNEVEESAKYAFFHLHLEISALDAEVESVGNSFLLKRQ